MTASSRENTDFGPGNENYTSLSGLPEELDENWTSGFLVGGIAADWSEGNHARLGRAFRLGGDTLCGALKNGDPHETAEPILFLYRHAIELFLKSVLGSEAFSHDLRQLIQELEQLVS